MHAYSLLLLDICGRPWLPERNSHIVACGACVQGVIACIAPDVLVLLHLLPVTTLILSGLAPHKQLCAYISPKTQLPLL